MPKGTATATKEERAEARVWARSYNCPHCGALPSIGYSIVTVTHSRNCPRYRSKYRKGWANGTAPFADTYVALLS